MNIKKGDVVEVTAGADLGKRGKVLGVMPRSAKAIVEGINFVYKHNRPTRDNPQGGRIQREAPVDVSNLMPVCDKCGRGVRTGSKFGDDGAKVRVCAKCGENM